MLVPTLGLLGTKLPHKQQCRGINWWAPALVHSEVMACILLPCKLHILLMWIPLNVQLALCT